jgi:8-oxo-dGTP diphosphatase
VNGPAARQLATSSGRHRVVGAILTMEGRVLLGHRCPGGSYFPNCWDLPGGHVEAGESPQAALGRVLREELGVELEVMGHDPEFHLVDQGYDLDIWVVRNWRGRVTNCSPDHHDSLGWFALDELAALELADPRYLGLLSTVLAAGKARLTWSEDGTTVTKTLLPGIAIPQWAGLLGTPRQAALNELRVNRLLAQVPPPVRAPRLISSSRRGPSMTFEAINGAPLGPKFPHSLTAGDLDGLVELAAALGSYRPRRRWFRRLRIDRRLALHCRSGLLRPAEADALAALAARPVVKWGFAHGDVTARNVLRDTAGRLALIDWEWAGLYPAGYELAFSWFSLVEVPGGRGTVESAVPAHHEAGFLLSAALVHLLHLQLSLRTPNPYIPRHKETLRDLLLAATPNSSI